MSDMNALELAELIERGYTDWCLLDSAEMLRRQHEAIVKLREALGASANYVDTLGGVSVRYRQVLAGTENLT